jgi:hypothetical protein
VYNLCRAMCYTAEQACAQPSPLCFKRVPTYVSAFPELCLIYVYFIDPVSSPSLFAFTFPSLYRTSVSYVFPSPGWTDVLSEYQ